MYLSYVHVTYTHTNTYALTYIHIWVPYLSCSTCPPRALPQTVPLPSPPIPLVPVFVSGNAAIVIVVVVCSLVATSLELHADFSFQEIFLTAVDWNFNFFNMQKKKKKKKTKNVDNMKESSKSHQSRAVYALKYMKIF